VFQIQFEIANLVRRAACTASAPLLDMLTVHSRSINLSEALEVYMLTEISWI